MARRTDVFYAYPSEPGLDETITSAISALTAHALVKQANLRFKPWRNMSVTGRRLITQITESIDKTDIFACDLTYPNLNVAFELGYAVGSLKRVWISMNTTVAGRTKEFQRLYGGIVNVGFASYANHVDLAQHFIADQPWNSLGVHLLSDTYKKQAPRAERPQLLYVKPPIETDAVIATIQTLGSSRFAEGLLIDDPVENPSPPLEWYAEKAHAVDAVLIHLLAADHQDSYRHNVKASFVAGLAHAFRKPLRMLAHLPFDSPIDYVDLLKLHETGKDCQTAIVQWVKDLEGKLPRRRPRLADPARERAKTLDLRTLFIGEPVAEQESDTLDEYFVETSDYYDALNSQTAILVGRRGTGKTATLYALETTLADDKRNHVCVIRPPAYEIDGLVRLLRENIQSAERGYLIESLWKFLVYSELACGVAEAIKRRPAHLQLTDPETRFVEYLEPRKPVLCAPFSDRLDNAVRSLLGLGDMPDPRDQKARISELLHVNELHDLRELLELVLKDRHKVAILIDNLDGPWRAGHHVEDQADLLLGLLRVATDITDQFRKEHHGRNRVNMSVIISLRSDILSYVQPLTAEQDKLPLHRMTWDDQSLLRVLDQRLVHRLPAEFDSSDLWKRLFPEEVVGVPTAEFITRNTLRRPRDLIYLVKQAIAEAVNCGQDRVGPADFLGARAKYSQYAFLSLLSEDDPTKNLLEAVLYEFAGATKVMSETNVRDRIARADVQVADADFYLNLLCDVNFLAIQTVSGFRFPAHESERRHLMEVSRRITQERGWAEPSYELNAAFHQVLQIE